MATEYHETEGGTLSFDGSKCIHSRNCVLSRPDVFVPNGGAEWIHAEMATPCELRMLAENCPSGAIQFTMNGQPERPPLVNTLHIRENGPYALRAEIQMEGEKDTRRLTLCRCGASKSKPYCDNSHIDIGFSASGEPQAETSEPLAERGGPVAIAPQKDGPLQIDGNLEICAGTGHTLNRTQQVFLCRCGGSKNKPYCDGSHQQIGFRSDD